MNSSNTLYNIQGPPYLQNESNLFIYSSQDFVRKENHVKSDKNAPTMTSQSIYGQKFDDFT